MGVGAQAPQAVALGPGPIGSRGGGLPLPTLHPILPPASCMLET